MAITEQDLLAALASVKDPLSGAAFVTPQTLRNLQVTGADLAFDVEMAYPAKSLVAQLRSQLVAAAKTLPGVANVSVNIGTKITSQVAGRGARQIPGVKNIVAVASGKGGVGKSTTAVNLALALVAEGAQVGLLDADIYGPSQPLMTGTSGKPETLDGKHMEPKRAMGLQINSIGFLVSDEQAMVWRGPMASNALEQLIMQTHWYDLDYLIVDMPPGTGDIQLTLAQKVPLTGAVIVTTPQDIALIDAKKGITMFQKVGVPILGIVENMAVHICSHCGHAEHIFGEDGGKNLAQKYGMPYLGALPLALSIREQTDSGKPTVAAEPDSEVSGIYKAIARQLAANIAARSGGEQPAFPTIKISKET
ncbi:MAG: MRP family ATP-binding protein [Burkholderiales bacterium 66-5]|uniref:iron-sulfur cluster carrier protein ApbC n=1 Tax=Comamonas badia TaxID=265291 RepID=UPI00040DC1D0|nr:iron-sulfur cluster carrier protein ApbC [Comamonas badia]OJU92305.1 MAG: MRP family ATP-binding protein [Burkholderiales bacterium 66-5]